MNFHLFRFAYESIFLAHLKFRVWCVSTLNLEKERPLDQVMLKLILIMMMGFQSDYDCRDLIHFGKIK